MSWLQYTKSYTAPSHTHTHICVYKYIYIYIWFYVYHCTHIYDYISIRYWLTNLFWFLSWKNWNFGESSESLTTWCWWKVERFTVLPGITIHPRKLTWYPKWWALEKVDPTLNIMTIFGICVKFLGCNTMPKLLHGLLGVRLGGNVFFVLLHASSSAFDFSDCLERHCSRH